MLDAKLLKNPSLLKDMIQRRNLQFPLEDLLQLDSRRRDLIIKVDESRHRKNVLADLISTKRKMDSAALEEIKLMKEISNNLSKLEAEKYELDVKFKQLMMLLPNLLLPSVPSGYAESDNVFVRSSGTLRTMDFQHFPRLGRFRKSSQNRWFQVLLLEE
jgi:seryl-tRNA synthetase